MRPNLIPRALFLIYFSINLFFGLYFLCTGKITGDLRVGTEEGYRLLTNSWVMIESIFLCLFSLCICFFVHELTKLRSLNESIHIEQKHRFHYFFLGVTLLYLCISIIYPPKLVNNGEIIIDSISFLFLTILQPKYLILIYLFYSYKSESIIYKTVAILYFLFTLYLGYTGYLLYAIALFYLRNKVPHKKSIIFGFLILITLPFLRMIKYYFIAVSKSTDDVDVSELFFVRNSNGLIDMYTNMLLVSIERFQHVANVYFINLNSERINNALELGTISSYYSDGWIQYYLLSRLTSTLDNFEEPIQSFIAYLIYPSGMWMSQIGISGWWNISPYDYILVVLYAIFLIFLMNLMSRFIKSVGITVLNGLVVIGLVYHAWFNDVTIYVQSLIIFIAIISIYKIKFRI